MDPYRKILPLKAELLSMYPKSEVVQFHDILTTELQRYLLNETNKKEDYLFSFTNKEANPVIRISAHLWHPTNSSQESLKIMKVVEKATGLTVRNRGGMTVLQIANYPPGSHFTIHPDTVSRP